MPGAARLAAVEPGLHDPSARIGGLDRVVGGAQERRVRPRPALVPVVRVRDLVPHLPRTDREVVHVGVLGPERAAGSVAAHQRVHEPGVVGRAARDVDLAVGLVGRPPRGTEHDRHQRQPLLGRAADELIEEPQVRGDAADVAICRALGGRHGRHRRVRLHVEPVEGEPRAADAGASHPRQLGAQARLRLARDVLGPEAHAEPVLRHRRRRAGREQREEDHGEEQSAHQGSLARGQHAEPPRRSASTARAVASQENCAARSRPGGAQAGARGVVAHELRERGRERVALRLGQHGGVAARLRAARRRPRPRPASRTPSPRSPAARSPRRATGARTPRRRRTGRAAARRRRGRACRRPVSPLSAANCGRWPPATTTSTPSAASARAAGTSAARFLRAVWLATVSTYGRSKPGGRGASRAEPLVDAAGHDLRLDAEQLAELRGRELRHGDDALRPPRDRRQQHALRARVRRRVPAGMAQRRGVVDHDDGARIRQRRQVRRAQQRAHPRGARRQHQLLPRVTGAMDERARRREHRVAARPQRGQPARQLARPALDAAELGPRRRARVDADDVRHLRASVMIR